jgi:hypothetical protein
MHDIAQFLKFLWNCVVQGFFNFNDTFSIVRTLVSYVVAAVFFSEKVRERVASWEKRVVAWGFRICFVLAVFYAIFWAPFKLYQAEYKYHHEQLSDEEIDKLRPKFKATLFIDEIRTNSNEVRYHVDITNFGELTALAQAVLKLSGYKHWHGRTDLGDGVMGNVIEAHGGTITISPADPWRWYAPQDILWTTEVKITFWFVINGKEESLRTTHTFRIPRDSIHLGPLNPNDSRTGRKPNLAEEMTETFLAHSDQMADFRFHTYGMLPAISASNAVREFYVDDKTNTVRFYFHPPGKSLQFTNFYKKSVTATNDIMAVWDSVGAMFAVNGNVQGLPDQYWREVISSWGITLIDGTNSPKP